MLAIAARVYTDSETKVAAHRAALSNATPGELRSAVFGEALFGAGTARTAQAHAQISGGRTHVYSFGYRSTALNGRLGATHTVELPFVFDIVDKPWLHGDTGLLGPDPAPGGLAAGCTPLGARSLAPRTQAGPRTTRNNPWRRPPEAEPPHRVEQFRRADLLDLPGP